MSSDYFIVSACVVILFALYWKGNVRAGFRVRDAAFFIEASEKKTLPTRAVLRSKRNRQDDFSLK